MTGAPETRRRACTPPPSLRRWRHSLDHWPDAALLLDPEGRVAIANGAAQDQWQRGGEPLQGQPADTLLSALRRRGDGAPLLARAALRSSPRTICGEGEDAQGRGWLLRCLPLVDARQGLHGWLLVLVDVTPLRQAEAQRDQALRFLSHDARKSATTILAMLDLARQRPEAAQADGWLLQGIEQEAQAGLDRSDRFVQLARTQARPLKTEVLDLAALLRMVVDAAWSAAGRQRVRILLRPLPDEAPCVADRGMLTRAVGAMLDHALDRSPPGSTLSCGVVADGGQWQVSLQAPAAGRPVPQQLQLQLARTVAQRHGGSLQIEHAADAGCTVTLALPRPTAADLAAPAPLTES
ncbi:PAS domain-containing protein [Variovorax sp. J22P271]|uniref:sensor histidine kinase n=1 Tax=Variovorax davisae TaxID=3053515 RepID=UPI002576548A|nr:PAS domain-containing protein [Variovorax sp. J22P271]MDM0036115.1 PAS domain-containing protein [Variovorax sp. J22P271]